MLNLPAPAVADNHDKEDAQGYEWAEFNLPAAADMDVLHAQSARLSEFEAIRMSLPHNQRKALPLILQAPSSASFKLFQN